jgi:hypothetical protein
MSTFALYDTLVSLASEKENESDVNKKFNFFDISSKINKLNDEQHEIIAALIYHHNNNDSNGKIKNNTTKIKKNTIPFNGKTINESKIGILFNFDSLPELLQKIICYYVISIQI